VCTDIDPVSIKEAQENIRRNKWAGRIRVVRSVPGKYLKVRRNLTPTNNQQPATSNQQPATSNQ